MASSCLIGPFPSEGRSSSCCPLKGVPRKSIRSKRADVSLQGESSLKKCAKQAKPSQFPCREHRSSPKAPTVASLTCVLLLALVNSAQAASFEKHCIVQWEDVLKRLRKNTFNPIPTTDGEVREAAKELAGNFSGIHYKLAAATITTEPSTVSYSLGKRHVMTNAPYQLKQLVQLSPTRNVIHVPVLEATDGDGQTWHILPALNPGPVLVFVKKNFRVIKDDVHFYRWNLRGVRDGNSITSELRDGSESDTTHTSQSYSRYETTSKSRSSPPCSARRGNAKSEIVLHSFREIRKHAPLALKEPSRIATHKYAGVYAGKGNYKKLVMHYYYIRNDKIKQEYVMHGNGGAGTKTVDCTVTTFTIEENEYTALKTTLFDGTGCLLFPVRSPGVQLACVPEEDGNYNFDKAFFLNFHDFENNE